MMKALFHIVFLLLASQLFNGCASSSKLSPEAYVSWYRSADYPFRDTVVEQDITYLLELVPAEAEIARNLRSNRITEAEAVEAVSALKDNRILTFKLTIALPAAGKDIFSYNRTEGENSSDRAGYFAFGMKQDLGIVTESADTILCTGLLAERGISNFPCSSFLLDFLITAGSELTELRFKDRYLSEDYIVFDLQRFNAAIPQLKLTKQ